MTNIAIVGSGPGGLTLARLLQMHGLSVHVYERDSSLSSRPQGGTLDLHGDSGQIAIQAMGLQAEFARLSRPEGQSCRILDPEGNVLLDQQPAPDDLFRPEIDRNDLRKMLLQSLAPGTVIWNSQVRAVEPIGNDQWCLIFTDGPSRVFDRVVGCDGARSRVRPILSSAELIYSGITAVEGILPDAHRTAPWQSALIGAGSYCALAEGKILTAQRCSTGDIRVSLAFLAPPDWTISSGIDFTRSQAARISLQEEFSGWSPEVMSIWEATVGSLTVRPYYRLPTDHHWKHQPGITLIGDAAHLMTPYAGKGANLAMLDAVDLATALARRSSNSDCDPLKAFEEKMWERSTDAAQETERNEGLLFGPNAAHLLVELMKSPVRQ